VFKLGVGK